MDFRVLGSLQISVAGQPVVVSTARKRQLALAALLARAGHLVRVDTLVEAVWGQRPPASARRNLQLYVHGFRRILGDDLIATRGDGYLLGLGRNLDSIEFRRLAADGAAALAADDPAAAETRLRAALDLWRGPAFAEFLDCELIAQEAAQLELLRLETIERWAEAQLTTGATPRLAAELTELCRLHPYRESLRALLMRALYQTGRRVEALTVFRETRALLVDEVGMEPGPPLRRLHEAMLRGDEALVPVPRPERVVPVASTVAPPLQPRQLPAPPQMFTGRVVELAALDQVLDVSAVVISAIDGMAGIGKTALAVHAAHRLADRYPDGQLFIDLHGYTQGMAPIEPDDALDRMLRALGVPGEQIPHSMDERAGLYRSRLADQKMLILLDNAATETQVTPLLPGAPGCLVLVTSRRRLAGIDHTHTLSLDVLPSADAVALFTCTAGEHRLAAAAPDLLAETVELCGRLPLAIRIAAARLTSHPSWTVAHLAGRLREQQHRLTELEAGQRSIIATLDLSYQQLTPNQQHVYRLLGLHPGHDIDAYATAALVDAPAAAARRLLDQLLDAHLLQEPAPGRYRFHDLTRAHAIRTAQTIDPEPDRRAALTRLFDYYRHTAAAAMDTAYPYEHDRTPHVPPAAMPTPNLDDPTRAAAWLDAELPNLLAAARYAADHGWPDHIVYLSGILHQHLRTRGRYRDAEALHHQALTTARSTGNHVGEMDTLTGLGDVYLLQGLYVQAAQHFEWALAIAETIGHRLGELNALIGLGEVHLLQGRYEQAAEHLGQVLAIAQTTGHRVGELDALRGLAYVHRRRGRYEQAAVNYQRALDIAHTTGHRLGELDALGGLGRVHLLRGRYVQAAEHFEWALDIAHTTGHRLGELNALIALGEVHLLRGRHEQAAEHFEWALEIAHTTGHRLGELNALRGLGQVHRLQDRYDQATYHFEQALAIAHTTGNRNGQFEALHGLGRVHLATGNPGDALTDHHQALALATDLQQPADQARAHDGLAHAHHALNQREHARQHWQQALHILTSLGTDHTDEANVTAVAIRRHLTTIADH